jgi:hypothetical protein
MRHVFAIAAFVLPLFGADLKPARVATTERVNFPPGGTIRINGSYGHLVLEAWDRPEVEITVTKSGTGSDGVRVATKRDSDAELSITTELASRHGNWFPFLPQTTTGKVTTEYEIHVPRDSHLAIHNVVGYVFVNGVRGDIDASVSRGDILLMLRDSGTYSIDAKTKFGAVSSDFEGSVLSRYLVGQKFARTLTPPSQHLYLRMGFGGITIKAVPPEAEAPVLVGKQ